MTIGFDRSHDRRQRELTNNKKIKGKFHVRIMLEKIIGFAEHQEKATYASGYEITLTRKTDNSVLNKDNATNIGKIRINSIDWYVPHNTINSPTSFFIQTDFK